MNKNLDTNGTYFDGLSNFEPTSQDKLDLFWSRVESMRDPLLSEPARSNSFKSHPAYRWAIYNTDLSKSDIESFTVFSNNYRDLDGNFTTPLETVYSRFTQETEL